MSVMKVASDSGRTFLFPEEIPPSDAEETLPGRLLDIFRQRIEDTLALVKRMPHDDRRLAVEFWNEISERLQVLVLNSDSKMEIEDGDGGIEGRVIIVDTDANTAAIPGREDDGAVDAGEPPTTVTLRETADADGEETESEEETAGGHRLEEPAAAPAVEVSDEFVPVHSAAEAKEAVTLTMVEVVEEEQPKLLGEEGTEVAAAAAETVPAVELTKIVSAEEVGGNEDKVDSGDAKEDAERTAEAILTENCDDGQVLVLDSDSKIVIEDGDGSIEGRVIIVDTDANTAVFAEAGDGAVKAFSKEEEWLNHAEKVTVDEYPPMLDEKANKRVTNLPDGSHEVSYTKKFDNDFE